METVHVLEEATCDGEEMESLKIRQHKGLSTPLRLCCNGWFYVST